MKSGTLLENALYLSLKDRKFNRIPEETKEEVLLEYLPFLNQVLDSVAAKNGGVVSVSFNTGNLEKDENINIPFVNLKENPFQTIFRVEFVQSGGDIAVNLKRLGLNQFFGNALMRVISSYPSTFTYNTQAGKLYVFPEPSVSGSINVFGKKKIGHFERLDQEFPDEFSDTFLLYLQYYLARSLCAQFNAPWQAEKNAQLTILKTETQAENNTNYQDTVGKQNSSQITRRLSFGM